MNLKLKRDLKSKKISLSIKPKTGAYFRRLTLAFLIAASMHLMAFTLFHIDLRNFFPIETPPATFIVSTDQGGFAAALPDEEKQEQFFPSYLEIDRIKTPETPFWMNSPSQVTTFSPFRPDLKEMFLENKTALCKSHWHFSKGLFHAKNLPTLSCEGIKKGAFAFRLQDASIFWLEMLQSTGDLKLDRELEESLKGLYLTSVANEGIVEVEFLP